MSIYDLGGSSTNVILNRFLSVGGIYHVGIEVAGIEWSYGYCEAGSGVFAVEPTKCKLGPFSEQVELGDTRLRADEIIRVLHRLRLEWVGPDYNVINRNCVFFCITFLRELNPNLSLPEYTRALCEKAATLSVAPQISRIENPRDVFGSREKEFMWREAERLMREFERDETVDFSRFAEIIHSIHPMPPDNTPSQTRNICYKAFYNIRHQHYGEYMQRGPIRKLILNYR